jgi:TPR repeat protein
MPQTSLGILYYNGKGVTKDAARAVALCKQAAAGGNEPAVDFLRALGEAVPPEAPDAAGASPIPWTDGARHRREGVAPAHSSPTRICGEYTRVAAAGPRCRLWRRGP